MFFRFVSLWPEGMKENSSNGHSMRDFVAKDKLSALVSSAQVGRLFDVLCPVLSLVFFCLWVLLFLSSCCNMHTPVHEGLGKIVLGFDLLEQKAAISFRGQSR